MRVWKSNTCWDYLELIQRATARPLSIRIRNMGGPGSDYTVKPSFTGSNVLDNRPALVCERRNWT